MIKKGGILQLPKKRIVADFHQDDNFVQVISPMSDYDWSGRVMRSVDSAAHPPFGDGATLNLSSMPLAWLPENAGIFRPIAYQVDNNQYWRYSPSTFGPVRLPRCVAVSVWNTVTDAVGIGGAVALLLPKLVAGGISVLSIDYTSSLSGDLLPPLPCIASALTAEPGGVTGIQTIYELDSWVGGEVLNLISVGLGGTAYYKLVATVPTIMTSMIAADQAVIKLAAQRFAKYAHRILLYDPGGVDPGEAAATRAAEAMAVGGAGPVDASVHDLTGGPNPGLIAGLISDFFNL